MAETLLLEAGVMFAPVAIAGYVAERAGVSPIPLYILSGLALGEHVAGRAGLPPVTESAFLIVDAEPGVVYVSSSAVVTKTMLGPGWTANPESAPALGTLVLENLVVAVSLALVSALLWARATWRRSPGPRTSRPSSWPACPTTRRPSS